MEKIQFSIEEYSTGKYDVVTRDGRLVEIITTNGRNHNPVLAYLGDASMAVVGYNSVGQIFDYDTNQDDLFLVEKITYTDAWINQYEGILSIHKSIEDANINLANERLSKHHIRFYSNGKLEILETIYT